MDLEKTITIKKYWVSVVITIYVILILGISILMTGANQDGIKIGYTKALNDIKNPETAIIYPDYRFRFTNDTQIYTQQEILDKLSCKQRLILN